MGSGSGEGRRNYFWKPEAGSHLHHWMRIWVLVNWIIRERKWMRPLCSSLGLDPYNLQLQRLATTATYILHTDTYNTTKLTKANIFRSGKILHNLVYIQELIDIWRTAVTKKALGFSWPAKPALSDHKHFKPTWNLLIYSRSIWHTISF